MIKFTFKSILATLIAMIIVAWVCAWPWRVSGDCMEPAVKDGQYCFLNRLAPYLRQYQIGDIVLFKHEGKVWISRIVGLATNTLQIREGSVIVNGAALENTKIQRNWTGWKQGSYAIDTPLEIPQGHVFVLSDNLSAQHDDSRVFGPISKSSIIGLVW